MRLEVDLPIYRKYIEDLSAAQTRKTGFDEFRLSYHLRILPQNRKRLHIQEQ